MPASVLLALLTVTCLVALTPALVRRYDKDERLLADRLNQPARVLDREDDPRTPLETPAPTTTIEHDTDTYPKTDTRSWWSRHGKRAGRSVRLSEPRTSDAEGQEMNDWETNETRRRLWWQGRHRRVLYILLALNSLQATGVAVIGPGFWAGLVTSFVLLAAFVVFLRQRAIRIQHQHRRTVRRSRVAPATTEVADEDLDDVYVPEQNATYEDVEMEPPEDEPDLEVEERGSYLFGDGTMADTPRSEVRRDSGNGIRGRSYETPARLDR
ncbi:hypothetical protein [Haloglycomyces albus]|uniref:hypothetical protein n=1 Tax=Haloglycomyces albus TaxID=526067 RepID=UPI00046D1351|nr:hypothetical protein [Haloglycomyces albus]